MKVEKSIVMWAVAAVVALSLEATEPVDCVSTESFTTDRLSGLRLGVMGHRNRWGVMRMQT